MSKITNPKAIQNKSKAHTVRHVTSDTYQVTSGTSANTYTVHTSSHGATCTCEWSKYRPSGDRRSGCSHVVSVFGFIEAEGGRKVSAWGSADEAKRQHRPMANIGDGVVLTSRVGL